MLNDCLSMIYFYKSQRRIVRPTKLSTKHQRFELLLSPVQRWSADSPPMTLQTVVIVWLSNITATFIYTWQNQIYSPIFRWIVRTDFRLVIVKIILILYISFCRDLSIINFYRILILLNSLLAKIWWQNVIVTISILEQFFFYICNVVTHTAINF